MKIYEDANHPDCYYIVEAAADAVFTQYMREEGAALYQVRFAVGSDVAHIRLADNERGFEFLR